MINISLRAIRYMVATAEAGNITEAARQLNISQPSISAAIAQVETELGVQLFVRHHARGVTLTHAGHRVVAEARLLLAHAEDFAQTAQTLGHAIRGEISVGCFPTLAARFMPGLLAAFAAKQPAISIRLFEGDQAQIMEALITGRTEIALSYDYAVPDEVESTPLAELPPWVFLAADHPLTAQPAITLEELAPLPFILLDLPHSRDYFLNLFRAAGLEPQIVFRAGSPELVRGLVGRGWGYTLHNTVPRTERSYDGMPVAVRPLIGPHAPVVITSLRLKRQTMRPAVRALADFLCDTGDVFAAERG
ncbi:DNA-binding transcriptional regulator, LysR family [Arboricoccus pini]|uniref:DNA-binding transcriptional regulator, LysR family n=1 Tax=Arboricoccus pini TaxID=1963835 RepID=A0A212RJN2_9PROT|nr:LysR family transcriptional regulator [Arboricoccus pini]SNB72600.1 DNA-binding transcriptional regulator, LysR family [Arboricoccus pini]